MYFINGVAFTFDDTPDEFLYDEGIVQLADNELSYEPEDIYRSSFYLIDEQCHPLMFEVDLENPELLPCD